MIIFKNKMNLILCCNILASIALCDDIKQISNNSVVSGSFIQPTLVEKWTAKDWEDEFCFMLEVKMDQLIWQWTADSDKNKWYYYPSVLNKNSVEEYNEVQLSLAAAKKLNFKIWIGLSNSNKWWFKHANDERWLQTEFDLNNSIALELWKLYGSRYSDVIAGFYIPLEMDNYNFTSCKVQKRMALHYKKLCDSIHYETNKLVMISPFFSANRGQNASQYGKMWEEILSVAPIDVISLQDGVGVKHCKVEKVSEWFYAIKTAISKSRPETQLWANIETMKKNNFHLSPAGIEKINSQISAEAPYVNNFVCFSFNHYQSPHQKRNKEFKEYKELLGKAE